MKRNLGLKSQNRTPVNLEPAFSTPVNEKFLIFSFIRTVFHIFPKLENIPKICTEGLVFGFNFETMVRSDSKSKKEKEREPL